MSLFVDFMEILDSNEKYFIVFISIGRPKNKIEKQIQLDKKMYSNQVFT